MITVEYSYYTGTFYGTMPEAEFHRFSLKASAFVSRVTMGRDAAATGDNLIAVKRAVCEVADVMRKLADGGDVVSETNDGVSVSYARTQKSDDARLYDAAALWLSNTGLLYRGCG